MTVEDRLRRALSAEAERFQPSPDLWSRIAAQVPVGRARPARWPFLLVPALAAAAAVVVGVLVLPDDDERLVTVPPVTGFITTSTSPTTVTTAPAPPATPPPPATFLAGNGSEIVVVRSVDGTVERVVTRPIAGWTGDLQPVGLVDGGKAAVYSGFTADGGTGRLFLHRIGEARPYLELPGYGGALSPDGLRLAYTRTDDSEAPYLLAVRRLDTGEERVYRDPDDWPESWNSVGNTQAAAWLPDNRTLVLVGEASEEDPHPHQIHLFDTGSASRRTRRIGPPPGAAAGTSWLGATVLADGTVVMAERCCDPSANALVWVEPTTGAEIRRVRLPGTDSGEGTDADAAGRYLVRVAGGRAHILDASGTEVRVVRLPQGYLSVAW